MLEKFIYFIVCCVVVVVIIISPFAFWFTFGGLHLDYLRDNGLTKAKEVCDNDNILYEGYERQIFSGFGGRVWYMCSINNIPVEFFVARRINNPELQVYNIKQLFTLPTEFTIN